MALGAAMVFGLFAANAGPPRNDAHAAGNVNPISIENSQGGASGWGQLYASSNAIEGYASETDVTPGDTIHFHVSVASGARYRIEIYRLGWYDSDGARMYACLPSCAQDEQGFPQTAPTADPTTGEIAATWPVTDAMVIPPDWLSGYYLARLVLTTGLLKGTATGIPFVVRGGYNADAPILVIAPALTWEAYNNWGGKSFYQYNSIGPAAAVVSFNRPYAGSFPPFEFELQLVRFLERENYDVTYTTDVAIDRSPDELLQHRLVIVAGHSEYWTKTLRDAFEQARDQGTNLMFFGANAGWWQVRLADGGSSIVGYRSSQDPSQDPALRAEPFQSLQPPRPECSLRGVNWSGGILAAGEDAHDFTVVAPSSDPWFAQTGLTTGDVLRGVVGREWDTYVPGCVPNATVLFHYEAAVPADAVRYVAPSGARVFSTGTLQFSWSLDDWGAHGLVDGRLQQFMRNALDDLARPAPPISVSVTRVGHQVFARVAAPPDPRVDGASVVRRTVHAKASDVPLACTGLLCHDRPPGHSSYVYCARMIDQWGQSNETCSKRIAVPNEPPQGVLRGPSRTRAGVRVSYRAVATDQDGDVISYQWFIDSRRIADISRSVVLRFRRGRHEVSVRISDGRSAGLTLSREVVAGP